MVSFFSGQLYILSFEWMLLILFHFLKIYLLGEFFSVFLYMNQAGLKIIQAYMEGYRQDWELSFEKKTRTQGGW